MHTRLLIGAAAAALALAAAPTAGAATYTVDASGAALHPLLSPSAPHLYRSFDADRVDTDAGVRIEATAGGAHDAGAGAMLDLRAPAGATITSAAVSGTVCAASGASRWGAEAGAPLAGSTARRPFVSVNVGSSAVAWTGCQALTGSTSGLAGVDRLLFALDAADAAAGQATGTYLEVRHAALELEDPEAPGVSALSATADPGSTTASLTATVSDAISGPCSYELVVDGVSRGETPLGDVDPTLASGQCTAGAADAPIALAVPGLAHGSHTLQLRATDAAGNTATATAQVEIIEPPIALAPPSLSGIAKEGATLTVAPGSWGHAPDAVALELLRCDAAAAVPSGCSVIAAGADAQSLHLGDADAGSLIVARETATNAAGSTSALSAPLGPVAQGEPEPLAPPTVSGTLRAGTTVTIGSGAWTNAPSAWHIRVTAVDPSAAELVLADADAATPTLAVALPAAAAGRSLVVEVDARNAEGAASDNGAATRLDAGLVLAAQRIEVVHAPGSVTVRVDGRGITLAAAPSTRLVRVGGTLVVRGRVAADPGAVAPTSVTVRLAPPPHWAALAIVKQAAVQGDGSFSAVLAPRVGGRLQLTADSPSSPASLVLDAGGLRVRPQIAVAFSARRDAAGGLRDLRVGGRVLPAQLAGARLVWEGWSTRTGWIRICRAARQPLIGSAGGVLAACPARGLAASNRYRLRFVPSLGSPYAGAVSAVRLARIRS